MHHHTISMQRLEELSTYLVFVTVRVNTVMDKSCFTSLLVKLP